MQDIAEQKKLEEKLKRIEDEEKQIEEEKKEEEEIKKKPVFVSKYKDIYFRRYFEVTDLETYEIGVAQAISISLSLTCRDCKFET